MCSLAGLPELEMASSVQVRASHGPCPALPPPAHEGPDRSVCCLGVSPCYGGRQNPRLCQIAVSSDATTVVFPSPHAPLRCGIALPLSTGWTSFCTCLDQGRPCGCFDPEYGTGVPKSYAGLTTPLPPSDVSTTYTA